MTSIGPRAVIVTGASQGIGAGIVKGFVERSFNVVANSLKVTQSRRSGGRQHRRRGNCRQGRRGDPVSLLRPREFGCILRSNRRGRNAVADSGGKVFVRRDQPGRLATRFPTVLL